MRTILPQSLLFCFAFLSAGTGSAQAPFNDDFSDAYVITAFPSTTTGTTLDATLEIDEPFTDAWVEGSVWFTWVATTTATIQVDTGGSASDPVIQIFSGTTLTSLTSIIENSRFDDQISSLALFEATEGTTYQIAVYGSYGWSSPGSFLLHLTNQIGAKISGHVISTESGLPLTNSAVTIFRWHEGYWYFHQFARTDSTGGYEAYPLPAADYRVGFNLEAGPDYLRQYYSNVNELQQGSTIALAPGDHATNISASLGSAAKISGTVTELDGTTPIESIFAQVYRSNGAGDWLSDGSAITDSNGNYTVGSLATGTYRVVFETYFQPTFAWETFDDAVDLESGTDIIVDSITTVSNIDASLDIAPAISGTVTGPDGSTPVEGLGVVAYSWDIEGWQWEGSAETAGDGTYTIFLRSPGSYRVMFGAYGNSNYREQVYDGAPDLGSGTDIAVSNGFITSGINAIMSSGASISGRVTGPDTVSPLEGISVSAISPGDPNWTSYSYGSPVLTDSNGLYTISLLSTGIHRVEFVDPNDLHISQVFSNAAFVWSETAQDILITNDETNITGIDASLVPASQVHGRVTDEGGLIPLENISILAILQTSNGWNAVTGIYTDNEGYFAMKNIGSGVYRLFANTAEHPEYLPEYYQNSYDQEDAQTITLADYEIRTNVNFALLSATNAAANIVGIIETTPNNFAIEFTGFTAQTYRLQEAQTLTGAWHDVGDQYGITTGSNWIPWSSTNSTTYWRIRFVP